jgi:DNA N-6-adenine-methyltransferase (Dam)
MTGRQAGHRFSNDLRYRDDAHPAQDQLTPAYVLDRVREDLGGVIELDPCTTPDNPVGALRFFAPPDDGAAAIWDARTCFVNPPYSRARERWVRRCILAGHHGAMVILLMPAATDTRCFQSALATASDVVFIRGRVKFGVLRPNRRQAAASHPSALIGWNTSLVSCATLGTWLKVRP